MNMKEYPTYEEERIQRLWTTIKYGIIYPVGFVLLTGFAQWLFTF